MARASNRLSAVKVGSTTEKGMYPDGGGLYLQVSAGGAKSWIFRFMLGGRAREMGLGPLHVIPLAEARKRAAECRRMRHDGIDPIDARNAQRNEKKLEAAKSITFDACRRSLHRRSPDGLAERKAPRPVAQHSEELCQPGVRLLARADGRCWARHEGLGADLDDEARDREPVKGADRGSPRLGHGAGLSKG